MASKLVANAFAVFSPVEAEKVLLGLYTFVPHYRSGIAASLTQPFTNDLGIRAEITMTIPVKADSGSENAEVKLTVRGPGDVTAIEGEIIRRYPEPGTPNAEPSDLAHIEFDSPDFPWQFTPAGPDSKGNVPPWLRLVVVNAAVAEVTPATANSLAVLTTPKTELPPENEAWAWAHAQVLGDQGGDPSVAQRLSPATPATNLSRLVSPRQLPAYQDWIACLVPTFQAGVEAGLGQDVVTAKLAYSWTGTAGEAVLPVYHYWTFSTGPDGDFETLAERLVPVKPSGNVGVRITDTTHPGNGIEPVDAAEPGTRRAIRGALTRPGLNEFDGLHWPQSTTDDVRTQLNAPAAQHFDDSPGADDPTIAPPIYAGVHTARAEVTEQPPWFRDVNLDPADRVVAGLGTRVVQMDQEQLMASAWAQVAGVEETNRALRAAQLGRYVSESMHRRHLKRLHASDLLAVTDRATARLLDTPNQTVRTKVDNSVLPTAVTSGITRRLLAARGRYTRFAVEEGVSPQQSRVDAVRRLLTTDDDATSWVRPYSDPDGVTALAAATAELLHLADPPETINDGLAEDGMVERLIAAAEASKLEDVLAQMPKPIRDVPMAMLDTLLRALPTLREMDADPSTAEAVPKIIGQINAVTDYLKDKQIGDWTITEPTFLRIGCADFIKDGLYALRWRDVLDLIGRIVAKCGEFGIRVSVDESDPDIRITIDRAVEGANPETLVDGFAEIAGIAVHPGGIRDIDRNGFAVDDLGLVDKLKPKTTITRRVLARLPAKSTWPLWLPKDWFDDGRVDQVMAAPNFPHPLYEALDRYDREWLMPGVAALKPHEMVTLLSTNARFVEAFLVGANHEFARELIWRGYPSDGRGTSFRSFWTPAVELLKPVHAFGGGNLGSHIDPKRAGRIVLLVRGELVRRYPNVLADIVTQLADAEYPDKFSTSAAEQLFRLHLEPDLLLVGFDITYEGIAAKTPKKAGAMWFTLSEHVGEPRFGLDETSAVVAPAPPPPPAVKWRDDLRWADMETNTRKFLLAAAPKVPVERTFRPDSAHFAWLLFQQPARVAYAGLDMMNKIH